MLSLDAFFSGSTAIESGTLFNLTLGYFFGRFFKSIELPQAAVKYWPQREDWRNLGGDKEVEVNPPVDEANPNSYWYRMSYNPECARFEHSTDFCSVATKELSKCSVCPAFKTVKANASVEAFGVLNGDKCDERGRFQWSGFRQTSFF